MSPRSPLRRLLRALTAPAAVLTLATTAVLGTAPQTTLTPVAQHRRPTALTISTFNILGSQHTASRRSSYAAGTTRARWAARLVLHRHVDVVGFQEIQPDQLAVVRKALGHFGAYPGTSRGYQGVPQNVMWDKRHWARTRTATVTIPFLGQQRVQPAVRLRNRQTGRSIWVLNAHNAPRGRQAERDVDIAREAALVRRLSAQGLPVFLVGDLNEHAKAYCGLTASTPLVSPAGGRNAGGSCVPPRRMRIDWIFGSRSRFSGYQVDRSSAVSRITDHAVLFSRATLR